MKTKLLHLPQNILLQKDAEYAIKIKRNRKKFRVA